MGLLFHARNIYSNNASEASDTGLSGHDVRPRYSYTRRVFGLMANHQQFSGKAYTAFIVACIFWILAVIVVCIRIYSRRVLMRYYGADDSLILAAIVSGLFHLYSLESC